LIDREYVGFPHLTVTWDSLRALYRPEIEAGVSRGRFSGIMGQLYISLREIHTWIYDEVLDSTYIVDGALVNKPGIPIFFTSGWGPAGNFGAALTPLPDSSLLVYRAITPHPLGIVTGDIVLGYHRIPWRRLYRELLAAQLPLMWYGGMMWGSSERSMAHGFLGSAGANWGLFDTVDIVKYATKDTLHLATAPLAGLDWESLYGTEQVPVPGVLIPNEANGEEVTWGVVENTSVGYVYVHGWHTGPGSFAAALEDLISVKKVTGLVIDFRYNLGGSTNSANIGFDYLFNEDPAGPSRWRGATRNDPNNHISFTTYPPEWSFSPAPDYFDRPIAMLTGPHALSAGDLNAFRLRFHPMARVFGLPTNGAFVAGVTLTTGPAWNSWYYRIAREQMLSLVNDEGFLMHKGFPVDEEVWLSPDGAARGEDDVVKRALAWINTLSYAHDVQLARVSNDTLQITARIQNPQTHTLKVTATLRDGHAGLIDSLFLRDDGLHGDSLSGDGLWGYQYIPKKEDTISVSIRTDDQTAGTSRSLPNAATNLFIRRPILALSLATINLGLISNSLSYRDTMFTVSNTGFAGDLIRVKIDSGSVSPSTALAVHPAIISLASQTARICSVTVSPRLLAQNINLSAKIIVDSDSGFGQTHYEIPLRFRVVTGVDANASGLPTAYVLEQCFPNPFNPSTTIRYGLPNRSHVTLTVYNMLGQQIAILRNGEQEAGYHEVQFDGKNFSSGVYLYRIQAGDFVATKRFLLLR
jgi:hypothetical protein